MTSQIDPTVPPEGLATTEAVRANFQYAKDEIEALQDAIITLQNDVVVLQNNVAGLEEIGEYQNAYLSASTRMTLNNNQSYDIVAMNLAAGDWDVDGAVYFQSSMEGVDIVLRAWVNTVPTTAPDGTQGGLAETSSTSGGLVHSLTPPTTRLNLTQTTTVYLGAYASTLDIIITAYGMLRARKL